MHLWTKAHTQQCMLGARTTEGIPYVFRGWNPVPKTECHCDENWEICQWCGWCSFVVLYFLKVLSSKVYDGKPLRRVAL